MLKCPRKRGNSNPFKFTAGYQSTSSGLFDFAARSYDPGTGRFTQADPRPSSVTDINRFAYVGANPTNATDPSGLYTVSCWFVYCHTVFTNYETMVIAAALGAGVGTFAVAAALGFAPAAALALGAGLVGGWLAFLAATGGHLEILTYPGGGVPYPVW